MYQGARELTKAVYALTRQTGFRGDHDLVNQMRRAAVSIMSNTAEGFERGSRTEFIQFLYIAKGSCGEVRAQLQAARDQEYLAAVDHERLTQLARHLSAMLAKFIAHLQQSDYEGSKTTGPKRRAVAAFEARQAQARAVFEAGQRAREERERQVHAQQECERLARQGRSPDSPAGQVSGRLPTPDHPAQ